MKFRNNLVNIGARKKGIIVYVFLNNEEKFNLIYTN